MRPAYTEIYQPQDQQEVILLKMIMEREGVAYFITNENLNSVLPLAGLGGMRLMVESAKARHCIEILRDELHFL
ncbi:MAG: putative signal transducing protein [Burkholderiales bacterium]